MHRGSGECVSLLLDGGADPNLRDSSSYSPLMIAVHQKNVEMVKLLIECERTDLNMQVFVYMVPSRD